MSHPAWNSLAGCRGFALRTNQELAPPRFSTSACQRLTRSLFIIFLRAQIRKDPAIATANQVAAASPLPLPADTRAGLIDRLASYLAPFFDTNPHDLPAAHLTAVRAIASYQPETQADCMNIARSISFSMSALAALRRAAAEMLPALQLRYFGGANSLNRSADQSERMMERRRRYQQACASPVPPAWTAGSAAGAAAVAARAATALVRSR